MLSNYLESLTQVSPFSAGVAAVAILLVIVYYFAKDRKLPPGPTGLPFLGIWPFLKEDGFHFQLLEMQKKYGDIFSFTITGRLLINLGTVKAIREAHVNKSECFAGRVTDYNVLTMTLKDAVGVVNGEKWNAMRKFVIQVLKEYGMTSMKDYMAGPIYDSLNSTVQELHSKQGQAIKITECLVDKCLNIVRRMLFNDDGISREEMREFLRVYEMTLSIIFGKNILLNGSFARYFILPFQPGFKEAAKVVDYMHDILYKVVKRHESTFDEDQIRDVIDSYIKERKDRERKGDPTAKYFTDKALAASLVQVLGDGISSVAMFIGLLFFGLAEYPEEQQKVYEEILEVVGLDRQPTIEDKNNLPYTNAFILEYMRISGFFPVFASLECTKETTLRGYHIPKGAITLMNLWAAHHDPEVYEDPDKFDPSRYVSAPGKKRPELPIIFGIGKRACTGEAFTSTQVFLFVTTIVKNFQISLPEGVTKENFFERMEICVHARVKK